MQLLYVFSLKKRRKSMIGCVVGDVRQRLLEYNKRRRCGRRWLA